MTGLTGAGRATDPTVPLSLVVRIVNRRIARLKRKRAEEIKSTNELLACFTTEHGQVESTVDVARCVSAMGELLPLLQHTEYVVHRSLDGNIFELQLFSRELKAELKEPGATDSHYPPMEEGA